MAKVKKIWTAGISFSVSRFPAVVFKGRTPFLVPDEAHRKALLSLGVFKETPDGKLFYSAHVKLINKDGSHCPIGEDGSVEYDPDLLDDRYRNKDGSLGIEKGLAEA